MSILLRHLMVRFRLENRFSLTLCLTYDRRPTNDRLKHGGGLVGTTAEEIANEVDM